MPQTRIRALVNTFFAAFNAGDTDKLGHLITEDVVLDVNQEERRSGRDAFMAFNSLMRRSFNERVCSLRILVSEDGLRAAAEYRVSGTCEAMLGDAGEQCDQCDQKYLLSAGSFFEFRAGRISRMTTYYNQSDRLGQQDDMLEAA